VKVTIKDVAKHAKVSPSTVSRALKNSFLIGQETKDMIKKAAKELDYFPNEIARSLANQTAQTLGLILPATAQDSLSNPFFTSFMQGVTRYLESQDYSLLLSSVRNEEEELNRVMRMAHSGRVDGIILLTVREEDRNINYLMEEDFPFVVVGNPREKTEVLWVDNDNEKAMGEVVEELLLSGHKKIAFLGGNQKLTVTQGRLAGYKKALESYSIKVDDQLVFEVNFQEEEGYKLTKKLLQKHNDIDAITTTDDLIAYGSIRAIKELGMSMPRDISVTGFNNTLLAPYLSPSLSSVEINSSKLGYSSAELLLKKIRKEEISERYCIIGTKYIKRDSSK